MIEKITSFSVFVQLMIDGLKSPCLPVKMDTFGMVEGGVCFGCAATNALCKLTGKKLTEDQMPEEVNAYRNINFSRVKAYADFFGMTYDQVDTLENAWDTLREGDPYAALKELRTLRELPFNTRAVVCQTEEELPTLQDNYTPDDLAAYQRYADALKAAGF